jgi:integrase
MQNTGGALRSLRFRCASATVRQGLGRSDARLTSPPSSFRLRSPRFVVNPCIIHGYQPGFQMREMHRLTARQVTTATLPEGENKALLHDGGGLYLQLMRSVSNDAINKSWLFKFELHGKRREMGLGSLRDFTLAEARQRHRVLRQQVSDGIDPLAERRRRDAERVAEAAKAMTFRDCFEACLASHEGGWKNAEHRRQWRTSIEQDVLPVIGDLAVDDIGTPHIIKVLEPIWSKKAETASRTRGRIERVLAWATVRGFRSGDNPARWRGHLQEMFPSVGKIAKVNHHEAMAYVDVPAFMAKLRQRDDVAARALEFTVLTAARAGEVLGMTWAEIDLSAKTWTIPVSRMKAGKEHRVPLTDRAIALLGEPGQGRIFQIGTKAAMLFTLREIHGGRGPTVHGFRSSFRDWCSERTSYPPAVAEQALAHAVGSKVERAYSRSSLFEKRRRLMAEWATWCSRPAPAGATVVALKA